MNLLVVMVTEPVGIWPRVVPLGSFDPLVDPRRADFCFLVVHLKVGDESRDEAYPESWREVRHLVDPPQVVEGGVV